MALLSVSIFKCATSIPFVLSFVLWYGVTSSAEDSTSSFMSSILENLFKNSDSVSPPQMPTHPDPITGMGEGRKNLSATEQEVEDEVATYRPRKYAIRRRVIKVLATTEEEEIDCRSRGGTPCTRDSQCCLGKCSPFRRCPTAAELFDAAAITLKEERDKRIVKKRKENNNKRKVKMDPNSVPG